MSKNRKVMTAIWIIGGITVLLISTLGILSATAKRPANLGATAGRLSACPDSPNCVCSQEERESHVIAPLAFEGSPVEAWQRLTAIIERDAVIVTNADNYMHAEFTSTLFRFVDDVEFLLESASNHIQVRSSSRVGKSDFGANRKRIESIRSEFETANSAD